MKVALRSAVFLLLSLLLAGPPSQAQQKTALSAASTDCSTAGSCLSIGLYETAQNGQTQQRYGGATITVGANASGNTLQFEASGDAGATWVALNATPSNSTTAATSTTSTGVWQANVAGYTNVRVRCSTFVGGTSTVSIVTSTASARAGGGGGGGGGTVTAVTGSAPVSSSGGNTPAISCATCTTSAAALTSNNLVVGGGGQAEAALGSLGTTTTVLHGNAAGAPTFGAVALATDVSGQLPIAAVGSGGLSATNPIGVASTGVISCATCVATGGSSIYTSGLQDFSAVTMEIPESSGFVSTVDSTIGIDTTGNLLHYFAGSDRTALCGGTIAVNDAVVGGGAGNCVNDSGVPIILPNSGADTTSIGIGPSALGAASANNLFNTGVGDLALATETTGTGNAAFGYKADQFATTGSGNTAFGYEALMGITGTPLTGTSLNTAIGRLALSTAQGAAQSNVAVGNTALQKLTTGNQNVAVGDQAAQSITTAQWNVAIGEQTLFSNLTSSFNTGVGQNALYEDTGASNTGVGSDAGVCITTGTFNVAVGDSSMWSQLSSPICNNIFLTGSFNTAVGGRSLGFISGAATKNTGVGYQTGNALITGTDNTFLGWDSGFGVTGNSNIILGEDSSSAITTGSGNILLGNILTKVTNTTSNQMDLGDVYTCTGINAPATSNCTIQGNVTVTGTCTGCSGFSGLTTNTILKAGSATTAVNSLCDEGVTTANTLTCTNTAGLKVVNVQTGTAPPTCTTGTGGADCASEGTAPTAASAVDDLWGDSTTHTWMAHSNGGGSQMFNLTQPTAINSGDLTAAVSTATLCAASAGACNQAGQYEVHFDFIETGTACGTPGTGGVTFLLTWTDANGTAHSAISLGMDDASAINAVSQTFHFQTALGTAWASGQFTFSSNGSVVQYATGYTACGVGTGTYRLQASVVRLQ